MNCCYYTCNQKTITLSSNNSHKKSKISGVMQTKVLEMTEKSQNKKIKIITSKNQSSKRYQMFRNKRKTFKK